MADAKPILIVGAGPVGLTLACLFAKSGTSFRIVDSKQGTVEDSRALGVHARTLEIMQSLQLAEAFVHNGRITRHMTFHKKNDPLFSFDFQTLQDETAYPYYLILPQSRTEYLLYEKLKELGGDVDWNTSLRSVEESQEGVTAHFEGRSEHYDFVAGCDGAASVVRKSLGIAFSGFTYDARFVLSEVRITEDRLPTDATHVILADDAVVAAIPLPDGAYRLVGPDIRAKTDLDSGAKISFDAFAGFLKRNGLFPDAELYDPSRVVSYRMQKRVADQFMTKRVFLAGDAAHIHSPAGGQGMNMGIQDAANLAWKLSMVQQGDAPEILLESYGRERRAVAEKVASATDRALQLVSKKDLLSRVLLSYVVPLACRFWQPRKLLKAMAQLSISYGSDKISGGMGTRVPWVRLAKGGDLFDFLDGGEFVLLHLSGKTELQADVPVRQVVLVDNRYYRPEPKVLGIMQVPVHTGELQRLGGVSRILIRPDGYIAAVDMQDESENCAQFLSNFATAGL